MKKKLIIFIEFILFSSFAFSESNLLYKFLYKGKLGYFNSERDVVIPAKYHYAIEFRNGYAIVGMTQDNYDVIDSNGNIVFSFKSKNNPVIKDELIVFQWNMEYGYYNLKGEIVSRGYEFATNFNEEAAVIRKNRRWYIIDKTGSPLFKDPEKLSSFTSVSNFINGLARVEKEIDGKYYYGFINKEGDYEIPLVYQYLGDYFTEYGLCIASNDQHTNYGVANKGVIDRNQKWIIPPKYYDIRILSKDLIAVRYENDTFPRGYWKLIDRNENEIKKLDINIIVTSWVINGNILVLSNKGTDALYLADLKGEIFYRDWFEDFNVLNGYYYWEKNGNYTNIIMHDVNAIITPEGNVVFTKDFLKNIE